MSASITGRAAKVAAARACWGAQLLAAPDRVLAGLPGVEPTPRTILIARILGVRHLTQVAAALAGSRLARDAWWVDALHATSMLGLAAAAPAYRRPAGADAMVAAAFARATRIANQD